MYCTLEQLLYQHQSSSSDRTIDLDKTQRLRILHSVACGIEYYHRVMYEPHCDINPSNVLLDRSLQRVKLSDPTLLEYVCAGGGNMYYKPFELLNGIGFHAASSDANLAVDR